MIERNIEKIFIILLLVMLLTPGCVGPTVRTYWGDNLQKPEVAVIKEFYYFTPFAYKSIDIYRVDYDSSPEVTNVEVLPGWHQLVIRWWGISFLPFGLNALPEYARVAFNFEAGHEYKIKFKGILTEGFKIVDVTTGALILNLPPFRADTW